MRRRGFRHWQQDSVVLLFKTYTEYLPKTNGLQASPTTALKESVMWMGWCSNLLRRINTTLPKLPLVTQLLVSMNIQSAPTWQLNSWYVITRKISPTDGGSLISFWCISGGGQARGMSLLRRVWGWNLRRGCCDDYSVGSRISPFTVNTHKLITNEAPDCQESRESNQLDVPVPMDIKDDCHGPAFIPACSGKWYQVTNRWLSRTRQVVTDSMRAQY